MTDEQKQNFNEKITDNSKTIDQKNQKSFDQYQKLKNSQNFKQEQKGDRTLDSVKFEIKNQKNLIRDQNDHIKNAKDDLVKSLDENSKSTFKSRSQVNKYASLMEKNCELKNQQGEKAQKGVEHFAKAERALKVDTAKGDGVITKLEQKAQEVKDHDARYKGTRFEQFKDAILGAANYIKQGGGYDLNQDLKRKIMGASGEKGREDVVKNVEKIEGKASQSRGMSSIIEKVQGIGQKNMANNGSEPTKATQTKPRDVFRGK